MDMIELLIKEIREAKGLTQDELSNLSGISSSYISELENNYKIPTILTLCLLAEGLEADVSDLYVYKSRKK